MRRYLMTQSRTATLRNAQEAEIRPMTVEEALQVIWVGPQQPIGELLAAREIGRWNLQKIANEGYGAPQVAAHTLLAVWDDLPGMPAMTRRNGPKVIRGSYHLQDKAEETWVFLGMLLCVSFIIIVFLLKNLVERLLSPTTTTFMAIGAILFFLILMGGLVFYLWHTSRKAINWERGKAGEEAVAEVMRTILDNRWTIFRNLHLPGRKDDLDVVLVGPAGIWVVEVKAYRWRLRVTGDRWERAKGTGWRGIDQKSSPSGQAKGNARRLRNFLNEQGIPIPWVHPVFVLSKPQRPQDVASADPAVWLLPVLEQTGLQFEGRQPLRDPQRLRIIELLRIEAEKQIARETAK
jgi:hypothetical protein